MDLSTRKKYARPQAIIFSDKRFVIGNGYEPDDVTEGVDAIVLSDHNRAPIQKGYNRIERRTRMVNATSRSNWTADKMTLSTSWENLPGIVGTTNENFVVDSGAGALDLQEWYSTHPNSFWVYLSYDNGVTTQRYIEERRMFFTSFSANLNKRGLYDMWDVNMGLEES